MKNEMVIQQLYDMASCEAQKGRPCPEAIDAVTAIEIMESAVEALSWQLDQLQRVADRSLGALNSRGIEGELARELCREIANANTAIRRFAEKD